METKAKVKIPLPKMSDIKNQPLPEDDIPKELDEEPMLEPIDCKHRISAAAFMKSGIMICGDCEQALLTSQGWVLFDAKIEIPK